jgi:hypothetical protein
MGLEGDTTTEKVTCSGLKLPSVMVSEPLLISIISSGSYSKITYSYNSHTSSYTITNHI